MVYFIIINWEFLFVCDLNIVYILRMVNMFKKFFEVSKVLILELYF